MSGRDCIGIAKTGSGKTLAFVLPMLRHIRDQAELRDGDGPIALIMAPTRELVQQIAKVGALKMHQVLASVTAVRFKQLLHHLQTFDEITNTLCTAVCYPAPAQSACTLPRPTMRGCLPGVLLDRAPVAKLHGVAVYLLMPCTHVCMCCAGGEAIWRAHDDQLHTRVWRCWCGQPNQ